MSIVQKILHKIVRPAPREVATVEVDHAETYAQRTTHFQGVETSDEASAGGPLGLTRQMPEGGTSTRYDADTRARERKSSR